MQQRLTEGEDGGPVHVSKNETEDADRNSKQSGTVFVRNLFIQGNGA